MPFLNHFGLTLSGVFFRGPDTLSTPDSEFFQSSYKMSRQSVCPDYHLLGDTTVKRSTHACDYREAR